MRKLFLSMVTAGLVFGGGSVARADVENYKFDTVHTQILFFVDHLGFSISEGEFLDFDGGFTFDTENPVNSSIDVTIDTNSIDMDDEKWDEHMKSADFFNVTEFPNMTFKSTAVEVTGEKTANITGDLTLLGVTKPVTLTVEHRKSGKSPFGNEYKAGFRAKGSLKRSDFGMNYGLPNVGDEVQIQIEVEAVRDEPATSE